MDGELDHDHREDRKRNGDSAYDEEFDRGRVSQWVRYFLVRYQTFVRIFILEFCILLRVLYQGYQKNHP
jgi:hypothetical protein